MWVLRFQTPIRDRGFKTPRRPCSGGPTRSGDGLGRFELKSAGCENHEENSAKIAAEFLESKNLENE